MSAPSPLHQHRPARTFAATAAAAIAISLALTGCSGGSGSSSSSSSAPAVAPPTYNVQIQRTSYGIPHVTSPTFEGIGYGVAYAYAQDNFCMFADQMLTVTGERSQAFGPDAVVRPGTTVTNIRSDFFYKAVLNDAELNALYDTVSSEGKRLLQGYVAGYNRYLRDTTVANLPAACRGATWVRPMTLLDLYKLTHEKAIQTGYGAFLAGIHDAQPPTPSATIPDVPPTMIARQMRKLFADQPERGSNAYGLGRDATDNGLGILLGNPHFPWSTTSRFYQFHVTIPGTLDVMGAALGGFPLPNIGFNNDMAWTHTVSTGRRFTLFELAMTNNGLSYTFDGVARPLTRRTVSVQARRTDGTLETRTRDFYFTHQGPMVSGAGLTWTASRGFAIRDANATNGRLVDQWLAMARARSVADVRTALNNFNGMPWVNTIAADRTGQALYADVSVTPFVTAAKLATCATSPTAQALLPGRTFVLDGTRTACDWDTDTATNRQIFPASQLPVVVRTDYVSNSNDSAWLANPNALQPGISPLVGNTAVAQTLRTRMGFTQIVDRLSGADGKGANNKFTLSNVEQIFFDARVYAAELTVPALVGLCTATPTAVSTAGNTVDLTAACTTLRSWNRRMNFQTVGAPLFREWWRNARNLPSLWAVPFSATDPINTPNTFNVTNATVRAGALRFLADAVELLAARGVALNATLGSVQYVLNATGARIPIDGGDEFEGTWNKMTPAAGLTAAGYTPIVSGSSYIQVVGFDATGPIARGILTYSQSTDPANRFAFDQTTLYSTGVWYRMPFRAAEITADPNLTTVLLQE